MELTPLVRVSTKEQEHDSQWVRIRNFAERGGHVLGTAVPVKASAFKPSALGPALDKLLKTNPEGVVVAGLDRATRGGIFDGGGDLVRKFRKAGVPLFVADLGQDIASMDDLALAAMISAANRESRMKSERQSDNLGIVARNKGCSGRRLYGYDIKVLATHHRRLVINEVEAAQVREAFRLACTGRDVKSIATALGWSVAATGDRLHNASYWLGRTAYESTRDGLSWVHEHPALVTPEQATMAHENLKLRRTSDGPRGIPGTRMYEGRIHCAVCGLRMYLREQRSGIYYVCRVGHTSKQTTTESALDAAMAAYAIAQMLPAEGPEAAELAAAKAELAVLGKDLAHADIARVIELQGIVKGLEESGAGSAVPRPTGAVYSALWASGDLEKRREVLEELHVTAQGPGKRKGGQVVVRVEPATS